MAEDRSGDLLNIRGLEVEFGIKKPVRVVAGVDLRLGYGQSIGIVGESGSGKSVTALSVMGLLPRNAGLRGEILFENTNITTLKKKQQRSIRGGDIAMIFQEPMTSLNPLHTCGEQIMEPLLVHKKNVTKKQARERALELLDLTKIPAPLQRFKEYPHQLSGGMRQRVMIAMALACNPKLLIADEPTTALDVTIQAQILSLMSELKSKLDMSIIMITHDLGIVAEMCEYVLVMYSGQIVEESPIEDIFSNPLHPYTEGLLRAIPRIDNHVPRLRAIDGVVPDPALKPAGCAFHPRCEYATRRCSEERPELFHVSDARAARCFKYENAGKTGDVIEARVGDESDLS